MGHQALFRQLGSQAIKTNQLRGRQAERQRERQTDKYPIRWVFSERLPRTKLRGKNLLLSNFKESSVTHQASSKLVPLPSCRPGKPDNNQCLEAQQGSDGVSPSMIHQTCNVDDAQQIISPMALPGILWSMHKGADRESGDDLHNAYSSYCGAHGALFKLSFGQIFGGVTNGQKSACQFAPVIKFGAFVDSTITYDKTSPNWPDWYNLLADTPILCADGEALTGFKHQPASNKFRYECSRIGGGDVGHERC